MSAALDDAWLTLKQAAEFNTPAAAPEGGAQSVYTPGQGLYVQSGPVGFNLGGGRRKPVGQGPGKFASIADSLLSGNQKYRNLRYLDKYYIQ